MRRFILALAMIPVAVGTTSADFVGGGGGFAFPDNDPLGASSSVNVALGTDEIITDVQITLTGFTHTWIGDLNATLTGPGGAIDLMIRTGDPNGDGGTPGDSSNVSGNYVFADGGADWWAAALAAGDAASIPNATYAPTSGGVGGVPTPQSFAGVFGGDMTNGLWTLTISDNAAFDTGSLGSWTLTITSSVAPIPEPASLGLLGLASVGIAFYRRRK